MGDLAICSRIVQEMWKFVRIELQSKVGKKVIKEVRDRPPPFPSYPQKQSGKKWEGERG